MANVPQTYGIGASSQWQRRTEEPATADGGRAKSVGSPVNGEVNVWQGPSGAASALPWVDMRETAAPCAPLRHDLACHKANLPVPTEERCGGACNVH